jgi:hypothetical protein
LSAVAKTLAATAIAIVLAHQASLLLHEWTHGTIAWIFGYKPSPFAIHYGDWTLLDADEAIDYRAILAAGRGSLVAPIAIAPIVLGGALRVAGTPLLALTAVQRRKALWVFHWFNLSNLGQVLDYIPQRTFVPARDGLLRGDVGHFVQGLGVSPWTVCVPGVLFVVAGVFWLLRNEVPRAYATLAVERSGRTALLALISPICSAGTAWRATATAFPRTRSAWRRRHWRSSSSSSAARNAAGSAIARRPFSPQASRATDTAIRARIPAPIDPAQASRQPSAA